MFLLRARASIWEIPTLFIWAALIALLDWLGLFDLISLKLPTKKRILELCCYGIVGTVSYAVVIVVVIAVENATGWDLLSYKKSPSVEGDFYISSKCFRAFQMPSSSTSVVM